MFIKNSQIFLPHLELENNLKSLKNVPEGITNEIYGKKRFMKIII